jgi:hypothetical protein
MGKLASAAVGQQGTSPKSLNEPVVVSVTTQVEYFVLVLIEQAVTWAQFERTRG